MSATNGARLLTRLQKQLKKQSTVGSPPSDYAVLDHLLFGVCLEDAEFSAADAVLNRLKSGYYDWNEVRVSSIRELELSAKGLPNPEDKAMRIKQVLQSLFETTYGFDLEDLRRKPLGQAVKRLRKLEGTTPFAIAYTVQAALGGHAIPVDEGMARLMIHLGIVGESANHEEIRSRLERYVPKARGQEFTALVRHLAVQAAGRKKPEAVDKLLAEFGLVGGVPKSSARQTIQKTPRATTTSRTSRKPIKKR
jgi:endonuclease-3